MAETEHAIVVTFVLFFVRASFTMAKGDVAPDRRADMKENISVFITHWTLDAYLSRTIYAKLI